MTLTEKIGLVRKLFGLKADGSELTDAEVTPFLVVANSIVLNKYDPFGNTEKIPSKYEILQCRIANFMLVKQGAEGEIQHTENGVTCIYGQADIPSSMMNEIVPKAGGIGHARFDEG
jgi:hypothetical protein